MPDPRPDTPSMYVESMAVILNRWFTSYDAASASRARDGGFLFPYRHQFFITDAEGVRELGLDPADPAWERIGWDWVRPRDRGAWDYLMALRAAAVSGS